MLQGTLVFAIFCMDLDWGFNVLSYKLYYSYTYSSPKLN